MSSNDEKKTRKLVGMLIEVLHGDYSDTRDLAVVQLALLGQRAVPYICSYLKEEGELEKDLIEYHKMHEKWSRGGYRGKDDLRVKLYEAMTKFADNFKKKWGCSPYECGKTDREDSEQRGYAVDGALKALSLIGDPKAIPVLRKLPIYNYSSSGFIAYRTPIFGRAKETIERIQSGV